MSYLELSIPVDTGSTQVHLSFNPSSPNGFLFYAGNNTPATPDFLSLSLVNSRVELRYDLGSGVQGLVSDAISLNLRHTVLVTRNLRTSSLVVDGVSYGPITSPGNFNQLNVLDIVSLGGLRDYNTRSPVANGDITGFSGCITQLTVSKPSFVDTVCMLLAICLFVACILSVCCLLLVYLLFVACLSFVCLLLVY
jgi:hypothetical protein